MVRRCAASVAGVLLLTVLVGPAAGATAKIRDIDLRDFPIVHVVVSAERVGAMADGDVSVTENGVPVEIVGVRPVGGSSGDVQAVLAIDVSNSMRGEALATAIAAANRFIDRVPPWLSVAVISFAGTTRVVAPMTTDRRALHAAIAGTGTSTSQGTALYDGVIAASGLFDGRGQRNLIVLTDGRDTMSAADLETAIVTARDADVTVFSIGLEGSQTASEPLGMMADRTRGAYAVISPDDLDAAYTSLAQELTEQYVVSYRSKAPHGVPVAIEVDLADSRETVRFVTPAPVGAPGEERTLGGMRGLLASPGGFLIPVAMTFLAAVILVVVATNARRDRDRRRVLAGRMVAMPTHRSTMPAVSGAAVAVIPPRLTMLAEKGAAGSPLAAAFERMLTRADWSVRVGDLLVGTLFLMGAAAFAAAVTLGPVVSTIAAPIAGAIPLLVLASAGSKRVSRLQGQLADVCMILASSLRAGHSFLQSLDTVAKEVGDPAATEFNRALAEIRLGRPDEEAMTALASRIHSVDLEWAVTAIEIQRKVGGNLAEVLETVAGTIRERETLRRQVRALTSEGRLSASILTVLPFLIAAYLMVVNPGYLANLTGTPIGILAIGISGILMIVGYVWMRRIVKIDA